MKRKYTTSLTNPDSTKHWKTKKGEFIKISDLPDSHLERIVLRLRKNWKGIRDKAIHDCLTMPMPQGEMAYEAVQQDLDFMLDDLTSDDRETVLENAIPQYKNLLKECKRRKINIDMKEKIQRSLQEYFKRKRSRLFE